MQSSTVRFLRALGARHRLATVALGVLTHALPLGLGLAVLDLVAPRWLPPVAGVAMLWIALVALVLGLRARVPVAAADKELGLEDSLLTYVGLRRARHPPVRAFASWLAVDLDRRLAALPQGRAAKVGRGALGAVRYLLPVLVLLLLLRGFAPLRPAVPAPFGPALPSASGEGGQEPSDSSGAPGEPDPAEPDAAGSPPEVPPPKPPPDAPADSGTDPPRPPLDLKPVDVLAAPAFAGDGPSRKELARRFALAEGERPGAARTAEERAGARTPPPPDAADYRQAREQALGARRVPAAERPFVKAYFDRLVELGR